MGLTLEEALPYNAFAQHLQIPIWTPESVPGLSTDHVAQLTEHGSDEWSALTVTVNGRTVIVVNSSHSERRLANDVCHEFAHQILDHRKARLDVSDDGHLWLKSYSSDQEEEADWLAASLLLPRDGLLRAYSKNRDLEALAEQFAVSIDLVRMRVNRTGISMQIRRSRRKRTA